MRARNLVLCGVLATVPLGTLAHPASGLTSTPVTGAAGVAPGVLLQVPSNERLTSVAFNERTHARAQSPVSDPSYPPPTGKPLSRSLDKGLLLLLLAALVTHQLRRNQRLLSRQLTGA